MAGGGRQSSHRRGRGWGELRGNVPELRDLAQWLRGRVDEAGLTLGDLQKSCRRSRASLSGDLDGSRLPMLHVVESILAACTGGDEEAYRRLIGKASIKWKRAAEPLGMPKVATTDPPAGELSRPWGGKTIGQWNPTRLGIHPAIGGSPLPPYVRRDRDEELRVLLDPVIPDCRVIVLEGWSSTGKTRSAFEAVSDRLPDWDVLFPVDSGALEEMLDEGVKTCTVLWLNEFKDYIRPSGSGALAKLRTLLTMRHYIVVITTMWPDLWERVMRQEHGTADEDLAQARGLLREHSHPAGRIYFETTFSLTERELASELAADHGAKGALAEAIKAAGDAGNISQALAGVPDLVAHYEDHQTGRGGSGQRATAWRTAPEEHPSPYGWAVITAAIDAVRLGHAGRLTPGLLREAAVGYLSASQSGDAPGNWFAIGLTYATEKLRGTFRALSPLAESPDGPKVYQLADFLDQYGREARARALVPTSTWHSLITHTTEPDDLFFVGRSARNRNLLKFAFRLWERAAELGFAAAMRELADLSDNAARHGDGMVWRLRAAEAGDIDAMLNLSSQAENRGHVNEALDWERRAARRGDPEVMINLAIGLLRERKATEAEEWLSRAAETGDASAMSLLADQLEKTGRRRESVVWRQRAADAGDIREMLDLAARLVKRGRRAEGWAWRRRAIETAYDTDWVLEELSVALKRARREDAAAVLRAGAAVGSTWAMRMLASLLEKDGQIDEAEAWLCQAAAHGDSSAMQAHVYLGMRTGRAREAFQMLIQAAEGGDSNAMQALADLLDHNKMKEEAQQWARRAALAGKPFTGFILAHELKLAGKTEESEELLCRLAEIGGPLEKQDYLNLLQRSGRDTEAEQLLRQGAETGDCWAIDHLAGLLQETGRHDEAEQWLRQVIEIGEKTSTGDLIPKLVSLLNATGREKEGEHIRRFGIEPGGKTACP